MKNESSCWLAWLFVAGLACGLTVQGDVVTNLNDGVALSDSAAWAGGKVPGADDVAYFASSTPMTVTLDGDKSWKGLVLANMCGVNFSTVQSAAGTTSRLTLGSEGFTITSTNIAFARTYVRVPVTVSGDQAWRLDSNKTAHFIRSVTIDGGTLTLQKGAGGSLTRACFYEPIEKGTSGKLVIGDNTEAVLLTNGLVKCELQLEKNGDLAFIHPSSSPYPLSSKIETGHVVNNGQMSIGAYEYYDVIKLEDVTLWGILQNLTVPAGESIAMTSPESGRDVGAIYLADSHVTVDGGSVSNNWLRMRSGSWTQKSGRTDFKYAVQIGRRPGANVADANFQVPSSRLDVHGGYFGYERIAVGLGNTDAAPAFMTVTGGVVQARLGKTSAYKESVGFDIGARQASGDKLPGSCFYAAGSVDISGGEVSTPVVRIGGNGAGEPNLRDLHSAARFRLSGGQLNVGDGGFALASGWNNPTGVTQVCDSYYTVEFSGGTVSPWKGPEDVAKTSRQSVDVRLSNADGGVTFDIPEDGEYSVTAPMSGPGGFTKTGSGTMKLFCANSYTGTTTIAAGRLLLGNVDDGVGYMWRGDTLSSLQPDAAVERIESGNGYDKQPFRADLGRTVTGCTGSPTLSLVGGHRAVSFAGNSALVLSGSVTGQPTGDKQAVTISMVFRTEPGWTAGSTATNWNDGARIFGQNIVNLDVDNRRNFGLSVDKDGHMVAGCSFLKRVNGKDSVPQANPVTVCDRSSVVNDGKVHVVFYSWRDTTNHVLIVDGRETVMTDNMSAWTQLMKTRLVLGAADVAGAPASAFFKGDLLEWRIWGEAFPDEKSRILGARLAAKYGAAWQESKAPVAAETTSGATSTLLADDLTGAVGSPVTSWKATSTESFTTEFKVDTARVALKGDQSITAPTLIDEGFNGHKAVSFNGVKDALVVGGAGAPWMRSSTTWETAAFSVAAVVRFPKLGRGGTATGWDHMNQILGTTQNGNGAGLIWGFSLSAVARVSAGVEKGDNNIWNGGTYSADSLQRWLDDGRPHVIVLSYPALTNSNSAAKYVAHLTVDGCRVASMPFEKHGSGYGRSFTALGGSNILNANHFQAVDIAEIQFWRGTELTEGQVRTVSTNLAAKYGAELQGYASDPKGQQSREVRVAAGAVYGAAGDAGFDLWPDQTLSGDGDLEGLLRIHDGATLVASANEDLSGADLYLDEGAIIRLETDAQGAVKPIALSGNLYLGGEVTVDLAGLAPSRVNSTLFSWQGSAVPTNGGWNVTGTGSRVAVRVDTARKTVRVVNQSGVLVIFR